MPLLKSRIPLAGPLSASFALPTFLRLSTLFLSTVIVSTVFASSGLAQTAAQAGPELRATAQPMRGVVVPRLSAGANNNNFALGADSTKFNLGTDQSKFNLGTNRNQSSAKSAVGLKVDKENPAIMTIVGHNEADIEKLLAKRYHRAVIPLVPYSAPAGPMQQVVNRQQVNGQVTTQQVVAQQNIVAQHPAFQSNWNCRNMATIPIETVNRFMNMLMPGSKPPTPELSAEAKPLKAFGEPTYIRWDPWYKRIQAVASAHWQSYNNQLNTEVVAHVTVYPTDTLAVTGVDVNLWKSAHPWDSKFNDAAKQAVLEVLNSLKGTPILKFPAHTRRTEVSFDLVFATGCWPTIKIVICRDNNLDLVATGGDRLAKQS